MKENTTQANATAENATATNTTAANATLENTNLENYTVLWTADGSPSLRGEGEPMHHLGGAYTETQYIYGDALRRFGLQFPADDQWSVAVVGLGLGYIELLATAEAIKQNKSLNLVSYELDSSLVEGFLGWLSGKNNNSVYQRMYDFFQKDYPAIDIRQELQRMCTTGQWEIKGALGLSNMPVSPCHLILFDAFSGKSTPDLWTEEFLREFLERGAQAHCVFATYACTGVLKRSLGAQGFTVEKRPGFQGKRDSTLGTRGL